MGVGICLICGSKAESKRKLIPKYCSLECNGIAGNNREKAKRKIIRDDDPIMCAYCGQNKAQNSYRGGANRCCSDYCRKRQKLVRMRKYFYGDRVADFKTYKMRFYKHTLRNIVRIFNDEQSLKKITEKKLMSREQKAVNGLKRVEEKEEDMIINPYFLKR